MRETYTSGEQVRLDVTFRNTSIVEVVCQTPGKMYTRVKSGGEEWDVMTNRLTRLENGK